MSSSIPGFSLTTHRLVQQDVRCFLHFFFYPKYVFWPPLTDKKPTALHEGFSGGDDDDGGVYKIRCSMFCLFSQTRGCVWPRCSVSRVVVDVVVVVIVVNRVCVGACALRLSRVIRPPRPRTRAILRGREYRIFKTPFYFSRVNSLYERCFDHVGHASGPPYHITIATYPSSSVCLLFSRFFFFVVFFFSNLTQQFKQVKS